jgi:CheY-like chemotaxis protein
MVQRERYDIVFMDHMMPEMDGIEATRRIRALAAGLGEYYEQLPIIALTANAITGIREMYLSHGFDDYLSKPIDISKLDEILSAWIPKEKRL